MLGAPPDTDHMIKASTINPLGLKIQGPDDECFDTGFEFVASKISGGLERLVGAQVISPYREYVHRKSTMSTCAEDITPPRGNRGPVFGSRHLEIGRGGVHGLRLA